MFRIIGYLLFIIASFSSSYLMYTGYMNDTENGIFKIIFLLWGMFCCVMVILEVICALNFEEKKEPSIDVVNHLDRPKISHLIDNGQDF